MQLHKMLLDDVEEEQFELVAIHCSVEDYKMAYLLNKHLRLQLKRTRRDIDLKLDSVLASFPLFTFKDPASHCSYYLVSNKFKGLSEKVISKGSLFTEEEVRPLLINLIPEYKKVDLFLKIEDDLENHEIDKLLNIINHIPQVITAYGVEVSQLKSKQNLIFE